MSTSLHHTPSPPCLIRRRRPLPALTISHSGIRSSAQKVRVRRKPRFAKCNPTAVCCHAFVHDGPVTRAAEGPGLLIRMATRHTAGSNPARSSTLKDQCPERQRERTLNPLRKLRRFESDLVCQTTSFDRPMTRKARGAVCHRHESSTRARMILLAQTASMRNRDSAGNGPESRPGTDRRAGRAAQRAPGWTAVSIHDIQAILERQPEGIAGTVC